MDPKEVLNGRGAEVYGGRFASIGTRAVFLAESDSAASDEVLARKRRLGGSVQITLDKYPGLVFGVAVSLERALDLSKRGLPKALASVRQSCVAPDELTASMELGDLLCERSVQGLVFPSAAGRGKEPDRISGALSCGCAGDSQCRGAHEKDEANSKEAKMRASPCHTVLKSSHRGRRRAIPS
jgi:RES domain-containing protein